MTSKEPLTVEQAEAVYDVLVAECGASEGWRRSFVASETARHESEFRFQGSLGFGGKFWRNTGYRPDGTWGEVWYVNTYGEAMDDYRRDAIDRANARLAALLESYR